MNISFIGFGNMAQAIARGLSSIPDLQIKASAPSLPIRKNADGVETHDTNTAILKDAELIILATKPAQIHTVLQEIHADIPHHAVIISIAAGITLESLTPYFNHPQAMIRAMPNLGASISQSATPLYSNPYATDTQKKIAEAIFNHIGITTWIDNESMMDAFTALSGSGPAYVFLFAEAMIKAAAELGIPTDIATSFTLQTYQGALSLAAQKNTPLSNLRQQVTSKGGTTAAALDVFSELKLDEMVLKAMQAAVDRGRILGRRIS